MDKFINVGDTAWLKCKVVSADSGKLVMVEYGDLVFYATPEDLKHDSEVKV